jgi:hypothetical protein
MTLAKIVKPVTEPENAKVRTSSNPSAEGWLVAKEGLRVASGKSGSVSLANPAARVIPLLARFLSDFTLGLADR